MIQLADIEKLTKDDIPKLDDLITPELNKRSELYKRYTRKTSDVEYIGQNGKTVIVPFEKYIIDIASGYLGGKEPTYEVEDNSSDQDKLNIIQRVLNKVFGEKDYSKEMEILIDYITRYNDDETEHYQLVKDILSVGACYEILYENEDNELVYSRVSPLQTIAIWDYNVPMNLIGVVRRHTEKDINTKEVTVYEITDKTGTRVFKGSGNSYEEDTKKEIGNHNWEDVPFDVVEVPDGTALFEPVIKLIEAYEGLIQETKETFSYNNDAKLKVVGYRPENDLMIEQNGNLVSNPAREKEDETLLNMKVFYTPDDGDIDWITKPIEDNAIQNTLKTYIDLIMMNTGVPQTTDLGFTKADNASAIDRKFFSLEQTTVQAMQLLKMAYKRRWELIFDRINLKKNTKYDFRDVKITLQKNLPANENEVVDMYMKLRGLISDETIIERVPLNFDAKSELAKMEEQDEANLEKEVHKSELFNKNNEEDNEDNNEDNIIEEGVGEE